MKKKTQKIIIPAKEISKLSEKYTMTSGELDELLTELEEESKAEIDVMTEERKRDLEESKKWKVGSRKVKGGVEVYATRK